MSIGTMLYSFFLMPIQLVFELVFSYAYRITGERAGLAIIALSLAINILVLPLYRRADAMQEEERVMEAKLRPGVSHIKKTFRGDERTMMLQTYYRQNNYSPLYVLRSAVSLFLEIPFFIAAYRFLSGLSLLDGVSFGPIADLGKPDTLISIGGLSINVLPVIMTAINVISTIIFTKGYPLKTKIQLYGMAAFFLVFLYDSPSGLVFYWTLNNLFSLVKTVFYKIKNPKKVLLYLLLGIGACSAAFGVFDYTRNASLKRLVLFVCVGIALCIPYILSVLKNKTHIKFPKIKSEPNKKVFLCGTSFLTVLTGILIPSSVITASPQEFIIVGAYLHSIWYVVSSFLIAAGFFILWLSVFYWLFSSKAKVVFERLILISCVVGIVDYLFFGNSFGTLSSEFVYNNSELIYSHKQILINSLILVIAACAILLVAKKGIKITCGAIIIATLTMVCMSGINAVGIYQSVAELDEESLSSAGNRPTINLSKTGQNVVVIMLDRAMGEYIPYIMSEHPELEEQFSGFTYYSNTISFGGHTNFGVPALFGGYEYTPVETNKRDTESLASKHDEALKVMPVLFDKAGYDVTVCDPPYAGYKEIPDLSIYDEYPNIKTYLSQEYPFDQNQKDTIINNRYRNLFCFSIVKTVPTCFQSTLYNSGNYHQLGSGTTMSSFDKAYNVLKNLSEITEASNQSNGCFLMMQNDTTHNAVLFEDDNYLQVMTEDTTLEKSSLTMDGVTLTLEDKNQIGAFQTNIAALMRLGEWFEYLRQEGIYDNTRIIIVSDHGFALRQIDEFMLDDTANDDDINRRYGDAEFYYPLLLVKDFGSKEPFSESDEFMTNADVPTLAVNELVDDAKNPFTGKKIDNSEKTTHDQFVVASNDWNISNNNGSQFLPSRWYSIHDNIWDIRNWNLVTENAVLTKHN